MNLISEFQRDRLQWTESHHFFLCCSDILTSEGFCALFSSISLLSSRRDLHILLPDCSAPRVPSLRRPMRSFWAAASHLSSCSMSRWSWYAGDLLPLAFSFTFSAGISRLILLPCGSLPSLIWLLTCHFLLFLPARFQHSSFSWSASGSLDTDHLP